MLDILLFIQFMVCERRFIMVYISINAIADYYQNELPKEVTMLSAITEAEALSKPDISETTMPSLMS